VPVWGRGPKRQTWGGLGTRALATNWAQALVRRHPRPMLLISAAAAVIVLVVSDLRDFVNRAR
jgi:hypothetical protein